MNNKVINVILSGGSGTRLWPLSRTSKPKQFLQMFDGLSLFQHTVKRNQAIVDDFLVVTNEQQMQMADVQIKELGTKKIQKIIEPIGRNTAPAITLAALTLSANDIMFVTPSDQMIGDLKTYKKVLNRAIELAEDNYLVTFGIDPTSPNVDFGYIEHNNENVVSFREKPDLKTAKNFLQQGNFSWNSGMFCFKASVFLEEMKKYNYELFKTCTKAYKTLDDGNISLEAMKIIPSNSIDYAVMERSDRIKVVPSKFYWTDLGSFDSIINYFEKGNKVSNLLSISKGSSYAFSNKEIFSTVENIVVVDTADATLILDRENSNEVKGIYKKISAELKK